MGSFVENENIISEAVINGQLESSNTGAFMFNDVEKFEFNTDQFASVFATVSCNNIEQIIVPASEDDSIINYYKGLVDNEVIMVSGTIGSIVEKE